MDMKEQILDLYYNQHLKQKEITKIVGKSSPYISKIVKADPRNKQEKENAKNRKNYLQDYFKNYLRPKKNDNSYEQLLALLKQDVLELSYSCNDMSDYAFAKWNSSAYHTNKKGNLIIDKKLNIGFDVPKSVNMNAKVPTQKHKF